MTLATDGLVTFNRLQFINSGFFVLPTTAPYGFRFVPWLISVFLNTSKVGAVCVLRYTYLQKKRQASLSGQIRI